MIKIKENRQPLGEVINNQVQWNLEHTVPHPTACRITKVYSDNIHVDINTQIYGQITYVKANGHLPVVDAEGVLIFLNNNYNERRVII